MRLEQHGVHEGLGIDAGRLGLDDLGASHLLAQGGHPGVEGHVLGFERSHVVAVLPQDAAKGGGQDAFARIGGRALQHEGRTPGARARRHGHGRVQDAAQGVGQPLMVFFQPYGGTEPAAVFHAAIIGAVAYGDAVFPQQAGIQVRRGLCTAEQHIVGQRGEDRDAGHVAQAGAQMLAAAVVLVPCPLGKVRSILQHGLCGGQGKGVDAPGWQPSAPSPCPSLLRDHVAQAYAGHGMELGQGAQ